ncbi:MAG: XRE family transcriptional regulator [Acidobacteriota bacterium]|nr:XRE family transcriptional regulator [Acidobacteriota bacterium]
MARKDYIVGSGNVFEDLGHPRPAEALAKAELARKIAEVIAKRRLTQAAAAELLNLDQPKVSALVRAMGWLDYHLHEFRLLDATQRQVISIGIRQASHSKERRERSNRPSVRQARARFSHDALCAPRARPQQCH